MMDMSWAAAAQKSTKRLSGPCDFKKNMELDESKYSEDGVYESQVLAKYIADVMTGEKASGSGDKRAKALGETYFGTLSRDDKKEFLKKIYTVILMQRKCIKTADFNELIEISRGGR
jgi:hypothetical protein